MDKIKPSDYFYNWNDSEEYEIVVTGRRGDPYLSVYAYNYRYHRNLEKGVNECEDKDAFLFVRPIVDDMGNVVGAKYRVDKRKLYFFTKPSNYPMASIDAPISYATESSPSHPMPAAPEPKKRTRKARTPRKRKGSEATVSDFAEPEEPQENQIPEESAEE